MDKKQNDQPGNKEKKQKESEEKKQKVEKKIDHELEETFPASDPPSYSQPGNDDIKNC
jgi:hypothetical protein